MTTLTAYQQCILHWMHEENLGAVAFNGRYYFPEDIRNDAELAKQLFWGVLESRSKNTPQ